MISGFKSSSPVTSSLESLLGAPLPARTRDLPALLTLYEASYARLRRLAPELRSMSGTLVSRVAGATPLYATVLESHKYTTQLLLTYRFSQETANGHALRRVLPTDPDAASGGPVLEPFVRLSVYHDVQAVELLSHCRRRPLRRVLPLDSGSPLGLRHTLPEVERRWEANRFVLKWLKFCAFQGHMFLGSTAQPCPEMDEIVRARLARDRSAASDEALAEDGDSQRA